jgi:DNA-binding response OmpR family regulator
MSASGAIPGAAPPSGGNPQNPWTVLVVEDQEAVCTLVELVLQTQGFRVLLAHSGDEAMEVSRRHAGPIHLLLTDWYLPDVGGQELARTLAPGRPAMKVLFMSGSDKTLSGHDPASFLRKPFTTAGLLEKVQTILQQGA